MNMRHKYRVLALVLIPILLLGACTNLDDVKKRLEDHEKRLNELDLMVKNVNDGITNLQALINAQEGKVTIVDYKALEDGSGYELIMSDGSKIILTNGKDGNTPAVGVKRDTDGRLYWTINGEFMLDASGNKILAEATNGENGVTPMLQVNADGYWEVSLDGGKSYQFLLGEDGNPIFAKGQTPEIDFSIEETDNAIIITYNGNKYVLPKGEKVIPESITLTPLSKVIKEGETFEIEVKIEPSNVTCDEVLWESSDKEVATVNDDGKVTAIKVGSVKITATTLLGSLSAVCEVKVVSKDTPERAKLPIEYVALFNVDKSGTDFAKSHANNASGYFDWDTAMSRFAKDKNYKIDDVEYFMPTMNEWCSVVPFRNVYFIQFNDVIDQEEEFDFQGKHYSLKADYRFPGEGVAYAIRFKGKDELLRSAYRFEYKDNPDGGGKMMTITARYLGVEGADVTIDDVATPEYWSADGAENIVRHFSCSGYKDVSTGEITAIGVFGNYWSATEHDMLYARRMLISANDVSSNDGAQKINGRSVRLFSKK